MRKGALAASPQRSLSCSFVLAFTALSGAAPIASDDFTYADGALKGQNGGSGFSNAWSSSTDVAGGVVVSGGGNNPSFRNLSSAFPTTGAVWLSFDWGHNTSGVDYGGVTLFTSGSEVGLIGDVYTGTWLVDGAAASSVSSLASLKTGVVRITLGAGVDDDTIDLWVGPTGSPVDVSGAVVSTRTGLSLAGVDRIRIMGDSAQSFDNLLIGTTIGDVDAINPTPAAGTWTNTAGGEWGTASQWSGSTVATGSGTFSGTVSGGISLTKTGSGTQTLSGTNSYTGDTMVDGGILSLSGANLADSSEVSVASGTVLSLTHGTTDIVGTLVLDGTIYTSGVFNAANSGGHITGSGSIFVGTPPADPFASWIATDYPAIVSPNNQPGADPDNDGIANLVEYLLQGGNPSASSTGSLPTVNASGANFIFSYFLRVDATGTTQTFLYGSNLSGCIDVAVPGGSGVTVTSPEIGIEKVEIIVAKGVNTRLFGRLQVTQP